MMCMGMIYICTCRSVARVMDKPIVAVINKVFQRPRNFSFIFEQV